MYVYMRILASVIKIHADSIIYYVIVSSHVGGCAGSVRFILWCPA